MADEDMLKFTVCLNKSYAWYSSPDRIGINIASKINALVHDWCMKTKSPTGEKVAVTFDEEMHHE